MPHRPEFSTDEDRRDRTRQTGSSGQRRPPGGRPTRRRALAVAGTVAFGLTAGCLDSALSVSESREKVEPAEPGDDPDGTPSEFYHHLEADGITVDELYFDTDDDDLILFYESNAETPSESDEEIKQIYEVFRDALVDHGADVEHLYTEVVDGFDEQVEGWGANSQWAEMELAGEASSRQVGEKIEATKVYPDGVSPPADIDEAWGDADETVIEIGNETDGRNDGNDRNDGDENE